MALTSLELTEYKALRLGKTQIAETTARSLWQDYSGQVSIDPPSFKNDHQWILTNLGYVGHIPLADNLHLHLLPKIPLKNLFGMYEYAYQLNSFRFLDGMTHADSLRDFYEQLAHVLSRRVLDRARRGYYRTYVGEQEQLAYLRGRLDVAQSLRSPWGTRLHCQYEEHTADIEENQLLAWTLWTILRTGLCSERILPTVARAYRSLQGFVSLQPFQPQDCVGRLYNRLNRDYRPLHALCRFFLDQVGPSHTTGERQMVPFIVDMARLFELFVAEWLQNHLSYPWEVLPQEKVFVGNSNSLYWKVDLVIRNIKTAQSQWILDTKYKRTPSPSSDDIAQVIAYAQAKGCREACLVYPMHVRQPLDEMVGDIRVRSVCFDLMDDLERAGHNFLIEMGLDLKNAEGTSA